MNIKKRDNFYKEYGIRLDVKKKGPNRIDIIVDHKPTKDSQHHWEHSIVQDDPRRKIRIRLKDKVEIVLKRFGYRD